jgi:aminoglycoside 3-N-acetyltransferase
VHSSLSGLGFVAGGAESVIAALREVLGPEGTLAMPAYPWADFSLAALKQEHVFALSETPSTMGKITEAFRRQPGVLRSAHYTHSVCAQGPRAEFLTADHADAITPVGPGSPFARLLECDGAVLALGSTFGHITFYHVIEDTLADFPFAVYHAETLRGPVRLTDGSFRETRYRVHDPQLYLQGRIDLDPRKETEILEHFRRAAVVREGRAGAGHAYLFKARAAAALLERLAAQGITIYSQRARPLPGGQ